VTLLPDTAPVAILVPLERLAVAKSRLRPLGDDASRALVLAMLEDVLRAVSEAKIGPLVLLSSDPVYDMLSARFEATRVADRASSYNEVVAAALGLEAVVHAGRALVLPADLPTLRMEDVRLLAGEMLDSEVVIAPSDDGGTSALGLRPPHAMPPAFGTNSAALHRRQAEAAGLRCAVRVLPNLRVDIDTPEDLRSVADRVGTSTANALARFGLT